GSAHDCAAALERDPPDLARRGPRALRTGAIGCDAAALRYANIAARTSRSRPAPGSVVGFLADQIRRGLRTQSGSNCDPTRHWRLSQLKCSDVWWFADRLIQWSPNRSELL